MNPNELKTARIKRGITSKDMANLLKWSTVRYSLKENGNRRMLLKEAKKISDLLKLSPAEILNIFLTSNLTQMIIICNLELNNKCATRKENPK